MKLRQNLSGTPELGLKNAINRNDVDDYGHLVYEALQKVSQTVLNSPRSGDFTVYIFLVWGCLLRRWLGGSRGTVIVR